MSKKTFTGVNIQFPISECILSGEKVIETRTYAIPDRYLNQDMLLVETPGPNGKFKARIRAIIKFTECKEYKNKIEFYNDKSKHLVTEDSPWSWKEKKKFGWHVSIIKIISPPIEINKRKGIVFTKNISI